MGLIHRVIIVSSIITCCICFPYGTNNSDIQLPCPDYGPVEFAKVKTTNLGGYAAVVHIECDAGYHLVGKHKFLCSDGQWDQIPRPKCVVSFCVNPPDIANGIITLEGEKDSVGMYKKGTLVTYICNDGYRLFPPESKYRVCEKGIWTGAQGKCISIGCKPPKDIENGYFVPKKNGIIEEFKVGQRVYYSCKDDFVLKGSQIQQCIDDGTWSPRIQPVCVMEINGKFY